MAWLLKNAFRADTFPVVFFCGAAVTMAGSHLFKLATDPHTPFLKNEEQARPWENRYTKRYMTAKWSDIYDKKPAEKK